MIKRGSLDEKSEKYRDGNEFNLINPISDVELQPVNNRNVITYTIDASIQKMTESTMESFIYDKHNSFFIDIVFSKTERGEGIYEVWLYRKDYSVKELLFGLPEVQNGKTFTLEEIVRITKENISKRKNNPLMYYYSKYMAENGCFLSEMKEKLVYTYHISIEKLIPGYKEDLEEILKEGRGYTPEFVKDCFIDGYDITFIKKEDSNCFNGYITRTAFPSDMIYIGTFFYTLIELENILKEDPQMIFEKDELTTWENGIKGFWQKELNNAKLLVKINNEEET